TAADLPKIETIIVEVPSPAGPFGARGVGEPPIVPAPAAIANAVFDATGARITELPITPERIALAILRGGSGTGRERLPLRREIPREVAVRLVAPVPSGPSARGSERRLMSVGCSRLLRREAESAGARIVRPSQTTPRQ